MPDETILEVKNLRTYFSTDDGIVKAGLLAPEQVFCNSQYRPEMQGMEVPGGIYAHIAGVDVVERVEQLGLRVDGHGDARVDGGGEAAGIGRHPDPRDRMLGRG